MKSIINYITEAVSINPVKTVKLDFKGLKNGTETMNSLKQLTYKYHVEAEWEGQDAVFLKFEEGIEGHQEGAEAILEMLMMYCNQLGDSNEEKKFTDNVEEIADWVFDK